MFRTFKLAIILIFAGSAALLNAQEQWKIHDTKRPLPVVVTPGTHGGAPSDAMMLFDGKSLDNWQKRNGEPAKWKVENGYMEVVKGGGDIKTTQKFGDCQLHVEWSSPLSHKDKKGQAGGNSGVFLMGKYEVQVLNSHENVTYADGSAGALYGQKPADFNASRPPGEWQSYDIIFKRPRFNHTGVLLSPARITVLHNGVMIHDAFELSGATEWQERPPYRWHADRLPIMLQDHGDPVRFRNIWIRDLEPETAGMPAAETAMPAVKIANLDKYTGKFGGFNIMNHDGTLAFYNGNTFKYLIYPENASRFNSRIVDAYFEFHADKNGEINSLTFTLAGDPREMKRAKK